MRYYAIGDIHGQLEQLRAAHARIEADRQACGDDTALTIHLGDLVDRGPDSRGVIEYLLNGIENGAPWIVVKGNHDQIFEDALNLDQTPPFSFSAWTGPNMGGSETAGSYGVRFGAFSMGDRPRRKLAAAVPPDHLAFIQGLPAYHKTPEVIFVHAGIRPGLPLSEQIEHDLLWIRGEFLNDTRDHGKLIVHGHTPVDEATHYGNRVNLDTGAGFGSPLTAAVIEGRKVWVLDEDGRRALEPR
jgi:serine/threonine protein phosphatase 1